MQLKLSAFLKKISAVIISILTALSLIGGETADPITSRPKENTVTAYNADESVADYTLSIDAGDEIHDISDLLYGIFFEDINFAADGGLYAEKVINRSFEYGTLALDDELHGYSKVGEAQLQVMKNDLQGCLNENNTNYLVITNNSGTPAGVANKGFLEGMAIKKGEEYDFSVYAKALEGYSGKITVNLVAGSVIAATGTIDTLSDEWTKYDLVLTSSRTASKDVFLQVLIDTGKAAFDMISLMPETFKGHGMRMDLATKLYELQPAFLRFPGGCVIEGWDYDSAYNWKDSIGVGRDGLPLEFNGSYGDVAARKYGINLWTNVSATDDPLPCYMSYGLGFFEYFQLAEDIGAVGVPVLNCGLNCQMRGKGPVDIDSDEFRQYLQDMHDLVEFCRGDENTTWGKVRCSLGHKEPFELKYICIGNEQEGEAYFERYEIFLESFNEAKKNKPELYADLELIYSSGADDATSGVNYLASYEYAKNYIESNGITADEFAGATDHHYYNEPSWFFKNADHYDEDNYSRTVENMTDTYYGGGLKVFVGEYAARSNRLEAALAEAAYMTGLERNSDIVVMAAYAPLFGNLTATHWSPNLIWFNNHLSTGSINYYMQKLFSNNAGDTLIASKLGGAEIPKKDLSGMVGLGTWWTKAQFDNVTVTDNETGKVLDKDSFSIKNFWWNWLQASDGDWEIKDGKLTQKATELPYHELGASAFFGDKEWSNYTYSFEATKLEGAEGFYIPFLIQDEANCFYWNIGGWDNTKSALQRIENGVKTGLLPGTVSDFTVETGVTYNIRIVVEGTNIKGYIDDALQFSYDAESDCNAEAYQVVSTDEETGDIIIKLVNITASDRVFAVDVSGAEIETKADVAQVAGDSLNNDNILGAKEDCIMESFSVDGFSEKFNYTVPQYSATVIRLHTR